VLGGKVPVNHQRQGHQPHFSQRADSEPQVVVFAVRPLVQIFVLKSGIPQRRPPNHRRGIDKVIVFHQLLIGNQTKGCLFEIDRKGVFSVILIFLHD